MARWVNSASTRGDLDTLPNESLFLGALTKEEKEASLSKKMEEIKRKNEYLMKRHKEVEADKQKAEQLNSSVTTETTSTIRTPSGPGPGHKGMRGVEAEQQDERKSKLARGRGKRLAQTVAEVNKKKSSVKPVERSEQHSEPKSPDANAPPPDPSYKFLADRAREGPAKDQEQNPGRRHPRNFGGENFSAVTTKIRSQKERKPGQYEGPPRSPMDLQMKMTGRERREYVTWKAERDRVDDERMERQKNNTGEWRREWDVEKTHMKLTFDESPPKPPVSRRTEPAVRPAGRIGSGRFVRGEGDERGVGEPAVARAQGRGSSRGGSVRGKGHGGGLPAEGTPSRRRVTSSGSDEARMVEESDHTITIKIENEFAGGKGPVSPRGEAAAGAEGQYPRGHGYSERGRGGSSYGQRGGRGSNRGGFRGRGGGERGGGRGGERGGGRGGRGGRGGWRGQSSPRYVGSGRLALRCDDYNAEEFGASQQEREITNRSSEPVVPAASEMWAVDSPKREQSPAQQTSQITHQSVDSQQAESQDDEYHDAEDIEGDAGIADEQAQPNEDEQDVADEEQEYCDEDYEERDHHNSSAESLDRFIREHTLKVDNDGNLQSVPKNDNKCRESTPTLHIPNREQSQEHNMLSPVTPTSPQSPAEMKTPVGHVKVLDWGLEMENESFENKSSASDSQSSTGNSPAKMANLSISDESYQSTDKNDQSLSPGGHLQAENAVTPSEQSNSAPQENIDAKSHENVTEENVDQNVRKEGDNVEQTGTLESSSSDTVDKSDVENAVQSSHKDGVSSASTEDAAPSADSSGKGGENSDQNVRKDGDNVEQTGTLECSSSDTVDKTDVEGKDGVSSASTEDKTASETVESNKPVSSSDKDEHEEAAGSREESGEAKITGSESLQENCEAPSADSGSQVSSADKEDHDEDASGSREDNREANITSSESLPPETATAPSGGATSELPPPQPIDSSKAAASTDSVHVDAGISRLLQEQAASDVASSPSASEESAGGSVTNNAAVADATAPSDETGSSASGPATESAVHHQPASADSADSAESASVSVQAVSDEAAGSGMEVSSEAADDGGSSSPAEEGQGFSQPETAADASAQQCED